MSMTTIELARTLETLESGTPEKIMFGKLLTELTGQPEERIRKAARQVPIAGLRELIYIFNQVVHERRSERMQEFLTQMNNDGISADEFLHYLAEKNN